jgi:hypothetical protein
MNNLLYPIHGGQVIAKSNDHILNGAMQNELIIYSRDQNLRMLFGVMNEAPTMILDRDSVLIPFLETSVITSISGDISLQKNLNTDCNITTNSLLVNILGGTNGGDININTNIVTDCNISVPNVFVNELTSLGNEIVLSKQLKTECNILGKVINVEEITNYNNETVTVPNGLKIKTINSLNGSSAIDVNDEYIGVSKIDSLNGLLIQNNVVIDSNANIFANTVTASNNIMVIDETANIACTSISVDTNAYIQSNVYATNLIAYDNIKIKLSDGTEKIIVDANLDIIANSVTADSSVSATSYIISKPDENLEVVDANANILAEHIKCKAFSIFNAETGAYVPYIVSGNNTIDVSSLEAGFVNTNSIRITNNQLVDSNKNITANNITLDNGLETKTVSINDVEIIDINRNIKNSVIDNSTTFKTGFWIQTSDDINRILFKEDGDILFNSDNGIAINTQGISSRQTVIKIASTSAVFHVGQSQYLWNFIDETDNIENAMELNNTDLLIHKNINTSGEIQSTGNITTNGHIYTDGDVNCTGSIYTGSEIQCTGNISAGGNVDCSGNILIQGSATCLNGFTGQSVTCDNISSINDSISFNITNPPTTNSPLFTWALNGLNIMNLDSSGTLTVDSLIIGSINNIINISQNTITFGSSMVFNHVEGKIETNIIDADHLNTQSISSQIFFNKTSDNSITLFGSNSDSNCTIKFNDANSIYALEAESAIIDNVTTANINSNTIVFSTNGDVVIKDKITFTDIGAINTNYVNTFNYTINGIETVMMSIDSNGVYINNLKTDQVTLPSDIVVESMTSLTTSGIEIFVNSNIVGKWTEYGLHTASIHADTHFDINIGGDIVGHFDKTGLHMPILIDNIEFNSPNMAVNNITSTNIIRGGIFIVDKPMTSEEARNKYNSNITPISNVAQMLTPLNTMHILSNITLGSETNGINQDYPMYVDIENNSEERVSAYMSGSIVALSCETFSDERIKTNISPVNELEVFEKINKLNIVEYDYIEDEKRKRNGLIAQEVEKLFPQAVRTITSYIPDMMMNAKVTQVSGDNKYVLRTYSDSTHVLNIDDMIKINAGGDRCVFGRVLQVDNNDLTVEINSQLSECQHVFIVGKLVDDFKAVDYTSIFAYLVSAVQYLSKQLLNN